MKLLLASVLLLAGSYVGADELDNEDQVTNVMDRVNELPATLIMRKNETTGSVEVAHLKQVVSESQLSAMDAAKIIFTPVEAEKSYDKSKFSELDGDSSRESWYFYYGYTDYGFNYGLSYGYNYAWAYYPSYNYYGAYYPYYPYYNYNYGPYSYSYYRPYRGYRRYW